MSRRAGKVEADGKPLIMISVAEAEARRTDPAGFAERRDTMSSGGTIMRHSFTLEYWLDDDWYVGRLKEIPGVFSQGETLAELEDNIQDAYELVLAEDAPAFAAANARSKPIEVEV
jgi:predicted RNase H-like HicB family nuclease